MLPPFRDVQTELMLDTVDHDFAYFVPVRPDALIGRVPVSRKLWDEAEGPRRAEHTLRMFS